MSESCESRIYCNRPGPNHDYHQHLEYFDSQKVRSFRTTLTSNRHFFQFPWTSVWEPDTSETFFFRVTWIGVIQELENTQEFPPDPFRNMKGVKKTSPDVLFCLWSKRVLFIIWIKGILSIIKLHIDSWLRTWHQDWSHLSQKKPAQALSPKWCCQSVRLRCGSMCWRKMGFNAVNLM